MLAVNLGDDADTVGAVTGQLAGPSMDSNAIPERWLANLPGGQGSWTMADALAEPLRPYRHVLNTARRAAGCSRGVTLAGRRRREAE